jgi:hypothetical protein
MIEEPGQVAGLLVYGLALRMASSSSSKRLRKIGVTSDREWLAAANMIRPESSFISVIRGQSPARMRHHQPSMRVAQPSP